MFPEIGKTGDSKFGDAARNDAIEVRKVGSDIECEAMKSDPASHSDAKGADLRFLLAFANPDPDASLGAMRAYSELAKGIDHPAFKALDEPANILSPLFKVENHICDALSRAVIGVSASAAGIKDGKLLRIEEFGWICAGARGEQGWVLKKPNAFLGLSVANSRRPLLHESKCFGIRNWRVAGSPFDFVMNFGH